MEAKHKTGDGLFREFCIWYGILAIDFLHSMIVQCQNLQEKQAFLTPRIAQHRLLFASFFISSPALSHRSQDYVHGSVSCKVVSNDRKKRTMEQGVPSGWPRI
jgi:hypothetical protein